MRKLLLIFLVLSLLASPAWAVDIVTVSGQLLVATVNGEAMFFSTVGTDFSSYAGTDGGNTPNRVILTDAAGKKAYGFLGAAGGGEALGSEAVSSWTNGSSSNAFETFDASSPPDVASAINTSVNGRAITNQPGPGIYKIVVNSTFNSGTLMNLNLGTAAFGGGDNSTWLNAGAMTLYKCLTTTYPVLMLNTGASVDFSCTFSAKPMTDVPITGLHVMNALNGTTRNWTSIDSGFNPNTVVLVRITSTRTGAALLSVF